MHRRGLGRRSRRFRGLEMNPVTSRRLVPAWHAAGRRGGALRGPTTFLRILPGRPRADRVRRRFLADGIASGEPAVVFASPPRREAMCECLRERGLDVELSRAGVACSHCSTPARRSRRSWSGTCPTRTNSAIRSVPPSSDCARQTTEALFAHSSEMVSLLWQDGNTRAAVGLEELWAETGRDAAPPRSVQ